MIKIDHETGKLTLKGTGKEIITELLALHEHLEENYPQLYNLFILYLGEKVKDELSSMDRSECKLRLNSMYGHFADATYADTDSIKAESEGDTNDIN